MRTSTRPIVYFTILMVIVLTAQLPTTGYSDPVYSFGVVPQYDARHQQKIWQPIVDAVNQIANTQIKLVGSAMIPTFEQQFV